MKNSIALKSSYALSNFFFFLNAWNLSSWSSSSIKDATIGIEECSYRSNLYIYIAWNSNSWSSSSIKNATIGMEYFCNIISGSANVN